MASYQSLTRFVWQFMRLQKWTFLILLLMDSFTWALDALLWPYILHLVVDIFSSHEFNRLGAWEALKGPIFGGLSLVICVEISSRTMGFLIAKAVPKLQADIRMAMFDHIQHHSPHYFNERFSGNLANKVTDMTGQVESIIQQIFWPLVPATMTCLLGALFLWFINPTFAWILLTWVVIHVFICFKFTRPCDFYEHQHAEARSTLLGQIVDSFTNNFTVNLFFRFNHEKRLLFPYQKEELKSNIFAKCYVEKMHCVLSIFYFLGGVVGINALLIHFWLHDQVSTGQAVQVFNTMWSLSMILWTVGRAIPILFQSIGAAKQAYSVMLDPQDIKDKEGAPDLKVSSGEIIFDNVSFDYRKNKLFENKHVHIKGGEKVGLVGFTGAGKSTFVNLILRLFPIHQGKILIDGQEIAGITLKSLRRQIALIPQDPILFHRTLKENIQYAKPSATDEEIIQAAKLSHCDEFISRFPNGYETKVGERGTKLSGGEKQRVAIARAILADTPILILDEATSALDSVTEKYIQESLQKLMNHRTTIVIAHRLSTLSQMDRILVFDQGKIIEEGSHTTLLAKEGLYAHMWKMQAGGFLPS